MSIVRAEPFPSLTYGRQCLSWSEDNTLAIALENGLYVVRCGLTALEKDYVGPLSAMRCAEQVLLPTEKIAVDEKVREYDVRVPRSAFQADLMTACNDEFIELMWNRTFSPSINNNFSGLTFLCCKLSPPGADQFDRSILCTLSVDHRTSLYSRAEDKEKWKKVVDLCQVLYAKLDDAEFQSIATRCSQHKGQNKPFQKAKERCYAMAVVDIAWSHVFKDGKGEKRFALLLGATRSGHVAVWRMNFPVINSSSCSLVDLYDITTDHPFSLKYCPLDDSSGFVVVGYSSGRIRSFLLKVDPKTKKFVRGKVVDLWQDEDYISIVAFAWSEKDSILFAAKGPYLLAFQLQVKQKTLEMTTISTQHVVVGSGSFHIHCLAYTHSVLYIENQDAAYRLTADLTDGLKLEIEEVVLEKLEGHWHFDSMVVSPNNVFMATCSSPSKRYCHLSMRNPLRLTFHNLQSIEDACELLLKKEYRSFDAIADVLMFVKQHSLKARSLPPRLNDFLEGNKDDLNISYSLRDLKIILYSLEVSKEVIIIERMDEVEINKKIREVEELILGKHSIESLTNFWNYRSTNSPSITEWKSVLVMSKWLLQKTTWLKDEFANLIKKVQAESQKCGEESANLMELCPICTDPVVVSDACKDACEKGHYFARCNQTMLQITSIRTRKCLNCHHLARTFEENSTEFRWLSLSSRLVCTFCDNLVV